PAADAADGQLADKPSPTVAGEPVCLKRHRHRPPESRSASCPIVLDPAISGVVSTRRDRYYGAIVAARERSSRMHCFIAFLTFALLAPGAAAAADNPMDPQAFRSLTVQNVALHGDTVSGVVANTSARAVRDVRLQ